jgi:MFS family permease
MRQRTQLAGPRLILGASLLLAGVAIYQLAVEINERHLFFASWRWTWLFVLALIGLISLVVLLGLTWSRAWDRLAKRLDRVILWFNKLGAFNLVLVGLNAAVFAYLVLGPWGIFFKNLPIRLGLFWFSVLLGAVLAIGFKPVWDISYCLNFVLIWLPVGTIYPRDILTHSLAWLKPLLPSYMAEASTVILPHSHHPPAATCAGGSVPDPKPADMVP